ncbi:hypothetical protein MBLNU459_g4919t1 [Dothideomycetes sp. NU459]
MAALQSSEDSILLYQRLDDYDWDSDKEFQGGLRAILGSAATPDQIAHLTTRAKCYYFARKFKSTVDFQGYLAWSKAQQDMLNGAPLLHTGVDTTTEGPDSLAPAASQTAATLGNAPPPASFAEICELIAAGKPIPGIKDIPDTVLEGQGTHSHANARKKPWETDSAPASTPSWAVRN